MITVAPPTSLRCFSLFHRRERHSGIGARGRLSSASSNKCALTWTRRSFLLIYAPGDATRKTPLPWLWAGVGAFLVGIGTEQETTAGNSCGHSTKEVPGDPGDGGCGLKGILAREGGSQSPSVDETGIRTSGDARLDDLWSPVVLIDPGLLHVQPAVEFSLRRIATGRVIAGNPTPPPPLSPLSELVASR